MREGAQADLRCVAELGVDARVSDGWQLGQSGFGNMDRPLARVMT